MKIIYAMSSLFPHGTAYSSRALNICRLLSSLGHSVIVFCDYLSDPKLSKENVAYFEGIEIHYITIERTVFDKMTVMYRTPNRIEKYIRNHHIDFIVTSSGSNRFKRVMQIAKRNHIPLITEACEKFHPSNWKYGKLDFRYWQFLKCWNQLYVKSDGVIAISRYLQQHFQSYGIETVRIPTILDVENQQYIIERTSIENKIKFVFAGSLGGGKDRVAELIQAIYLLSTENRNRILFNIYGPSKDAVEKQLGEHAGILSELDNSVVIHGRVPQQKIPEILMNNDFGVILRPQRESSEAGFSTKLAECMEVGTPVFANATGDIELYVKDGYNGVLLRSESVDAIRQKLMDVLKLSRKDLNNMRLNARKTAIASFDYRKYQKQISALLDEIARKKE